MRATTFLILAALALGACGSSQPPPPGALLSPEPSRVASSPSAVKPSAVEPSAVPTSPKLRYVFPVAGKASYAREHHDYPASDIMAACGAAYLSPVDGVVLEVNREDRWTAKVNDGATRGGLSIAVLGEDGVRYYGAHFATIDANVVPQARVTAGQRLAVVGRTGNADVCHVHFGISPPCGHVLDWWVRRGAIWPWSYLDAWKRHEARSPAGEVTLWHTKNGCPKAP